MQFTIAAAIALLASTHAQPAETAATPVPSPAAPAPTPPPPPPPPQTPPAPAPAPAIAYEEQASMVERLREEASGVLPLISCIGVKRLLINTTWLPLVSTRTLYWDGKARKALKPEAFEALPETERGPFKKLELDQEFYYTTRYGSPLAYMRALDLVCQPLGCKECFRGRRVLDFGYGGIGHLRLLASTGAHVVGVEVDPLLQALYSEPRDTGTIKGAGMGENIPPDGSITLVHGSWPGDAAVKEHAGSGFDVIISKNVLKRGYIHPEKEVDPRMLVHLGVDDDAFLAAIAQSLNPGGYFIIYNISPKQSEEKYIPWADGRSPFSKEAYEKAGLVVLDFDTDDTVKARELGKALRWNEGENAMDLERDVFAHYTLVQKRPVGSESGTPGVSPTSPTPSSSQPSKEPAVKPEGK